MKFRPSLGQAGKASRMDPSGGLSPWIHDADISLPKGSGLFEEMVSEAENICAG